MRNTFTWLSRAFFPVYIGVCFDERSFRSEMKKHGQPPLEDKYIWTEGGALTRIYDGSFGYGKNDCAIMCFDLDTLKNTSWPMFIEQLAHESTHVKQHVYSMIGERAPGWESEAYMIGGLSRIVAELYEKHIARK